MIRRLTALSACGSVGACVVAPHAADHAQQWSAFVEPGEARLLYGYPESDNLALALSCRPGSGVVTLSQGGLKEGEGISLSSGPSALTLHGRAEPDDIMEGVHVTADTSVKAAALQEFRRSGRIKVGPRHRREDLHATRAEKVQIERFFVVCEGRVSAP